MGSSVDDIPDWNAVDVVDVSGVIVVVVFVACDVVVVDVSEAAVVVDVYGNASVVDVSAAEARSSANKFVVSGIRNAPKHATKNGGKKSQSATLRFHPRASSSSPCSLAQRSPVAQSSSTEQSKPHSGSRPDPDSWRLGCWYSDQKI